MKKAILISALAASSAMYGAVTVVPGGGGANWQTITTPVTYNAATNGATLLNSTTTNSGTGNAFWNNVSDDTGAGTNKCANFGCYLTGAGGWATYSAPPDYPSGGFLNNPVYLGTSTGGAVDFNFAGNIVNSVPTPNPMLAEATSFGDGNWLGWYDSTYTGVYDNTNYGSKWGVIFTGSNGPVNTAIFTPSYSFGLWALTGVPTGPQPDVTTTTGQNTIGALLGTSGLFTDSSRNKNTIAAGDDPGKQHFALAARSAAAGDAVPADYWVGFEDRDIAAVPGNGHDNDYQDMIVRLRVVPEPGYYFLLSLGLVGFGLARRRMNKTSVN